MSQSSTISVRELKERKERLKKELEELEGKYSSKVSRVSNTVEKTLKPISTIKKNPFKSVGIAIAVGFIAGSTGRSGKKGGGGISFTSLLTAELKRLAAKKAMTYVSDVVDTEILPRLRKKKETNNTSE